MQIKSTFELISAASETEGPCFIRRELNVGKRVSGVADFVVEVDRKQGIELYYPHPGFLYLCIYVGEFSFTTNILQWPLMSHLATQSGQPFFPRWSKCTREHLTCNW